MKVLDDLQKLMNHTNGLRDDLLKQIENAEKFGTPRMVKELKDQLIRVEDLLKNQAQTGISVGSAVEQLEKEIEDMDDFDSAKFLEAIGELAELLTPDIFPKFPGGNNG